MFNLPSFTGNTLTAHIKGTQISLWWFNRSWQDKDRWPDHPCDFKYAANFVNFTHLQVSFEAWFLASAGKCDLRAHPQGSWARLGLEAKLQLLGNFRIKVGKESVPFSPPPQGGEGECGGKSNQLKLETSVTYKSCISGVQQVDRSLFSRWAGDGHVPTLLSTWWCGWRAHGHTCWLCLQTRGSCCITGFTLNTEIHEGVSKTRKKPLEVEKDYLWWNRNDTFSKATCSHPASCFLSVLSPLTCSLVLPSYGIILPASGDCLGLTHGISTSQNPCSVPPEKNLILNRTWLRCDCLFRNTSSTTDHSPDKTFSTLVAN